MFLHNRILMSDALLTISQSKGSHGLRKRVPDFSYNSEQSYMINPARVPCLASSTFYKPTYVSAIRAVSVLNSTGTSGAPLKTDTHHAQKTRNPSSLYTHANCALRLVAPIREAQTTADFWEDELASLSKSDMDESRASCIMHVGAWSASTCTTMNMSNSWPMIDAEAEIRAMRMFLADTA